jgi:FHA domain
MVDTAQEGAPGAERRPGAGGRRITGVLSTFTWSPLGKLFQILDGRNYAGSGVVGAENNRPCDVQILEDETMSGAHFLILCQGGKYIISDTFSTNGTFLNGAQIDTRGTDLPDNSVIRAGATVFVFQKIYAASSDSTGLIPGGDPSWKPDDRDGTILR